MSMSEDISMIREDLTDIKIGIARIEERDTAQAAEVSDIQICLFGNGRSGLLEEVTVLKGRVSTIWKVLLPILAAGIGGGAWASLF